MYRHRTKCLLKIVWPYNVLSILGQIKNGPGASRGFLIEVPIPCFNNFACRICRTHSLEGDGGKVTYIYQVAALIISNVLSAYLIRLPYPMHIAKLLAFHCDLCPKCITLQRLGTHAPIHIFF